MKFLLYFLIGLVLLPLSEIDLDDAPTTMEEAPYAADVDLPVVDGNELSTIKTATSMGTMEDLFSSVAVYCKHWNQIIGPSFSTDLSFDTDDWTIEKTTDFDTAMAGDFYVVINVDGIRAVIDFQEHNVYSLSVPLYNSKYDSYQNLARIAAVICAVAYDFPKSNQEMKERYIDIGKLITDQADRLLEELQTGGREVSFSVQTELGLFKFFICYTSEGVVFSTKSLE